MNIGDKVTICAHKPDMYSLNFPHIRFGVRVVSTRIIILHVHYLIVSSALDRCLFL